MKAFACLILIWKIAAVLSLNEVTFKIRSVSNETIFEGPTPRIYGGLEAEEGQFKFMIFVLIRTQRGLSQCSASLLSPEWVLLAAHCVHHQGLVPRDLILVGGRANLYAYIKARLGVDFQHPIREDLFDMQERRASQFFLHPNYDDIDTLSHDIALIKVDKPFNIGQRITTIRMSEDKMKVGKSCTILGWGLNKGNLQTFRLNYVENKMVKTTSMGCLYKVQGPFICLTPDNRGICQGDSGSPLVCDGTVWGVASHLVSEKLNPDCGDSAEEYYAELHPDMNWIKKVYNAGSISGMVDPRAIFTCLFIALWTASKR